MERSENPESYPRGAAETAVRPQGQHHFQQYGEYAEQQKEAYHGKEGYNRAKSEYPEKDLYGRYPTYSAKGGFDIYNHPMAPTAPYREGPPHYNYSNQPPSYYERGPEGYEHGRYGPPSYPPRVNTEQHANRPHPYEMYREHEYGHHHHHHRDQYYGRGPVPEGFRYEAQRRYPEPGQEGYNYNAQSRGPEGEMRPPMYGDRRGSTEEAMHKKYSVEYFNRESSHNSPSSNASTVPPGHMSAASDASRMGLKDKTGNDMRNEVSHTFTSDCICNICGRKFRRMDTLRQHLRIHSGEKPFKCEHCGQGFKDKSARYKHLKSHSSERPFECHVCARKFKLKHHLIRHVKVMHNIELNFADVHPNNRKPSSKAGSVKAESTGEKENTEQCPSEASS